MRWTWWWMLVGCGAADDVTDVDTDVTDTDVSEVAFALDLPDHVAAEEAVDGCEIALPVAYECEGSNPGVTWSGAPASTDSFVLIFDDPDAGDFPHWAVWNLPADVTGIVAGASGKDVVADLPRGALELDNGFGWTGYLGSCPGSEHVYRWTLWAVDDTFSFTPGSGNAATQFEALRNAAKAAKVDRASACHVYGPALNP